MSDKDLVERPEDGPEDDREQTLVAHLIELRSRIVRMAVSVYGTGTHETIAAFLGTWLTRFATLIRSTSRLRIVWRICQPDSFSACTGISIPGSCSPHASPQFCSYVVQESKPVVHRIRLSTSP